VAGVRALVVDPHEATLGLDGQEIMTGDKVTPPVNAVLGDRVADPRRAVTVAASSTCSERRSGNDRSRAADFPPFSLREKEPRGGG